MTRGPFDPNASGMRIPHLMVPTGAPLPPAKKAAAAAGIGGPDAVLYRYQAFPSVRVVRPGETSTEPHCDVARGHSVGNINFHIPLTPAFGTNALFVESHPGREDWHPLSTKSLGLGYLYDGARCLHFGLENTTDRTRVSLSFRIAVARCSSATVGRDAVRLVGDGLGSMAGAGDVVMEAAEDVEVDVDDDLCSDRILRDAYVTAGPGYYDEAVIDTGSSSGGGGLMMRPGFFHSGPGPVVVKKYGAGSRLLDPDERVGFPFA
uniref:Uncharacterized protein n=1 Tax=Odontella aurita TaxID=265563 RepID=A0A7S4MR94_9STRA|mmetsp:Transcript_29024/g.85894  ORF Transcript_29024/g.85894 Transcript_29024/m.85894 type:complete len:263 (+) Transcript_29024:3-791(+)